MPRLPALILLLPLSASAAAPLKLGLGDVISAPHVIDRAERPRHPGGRVVELADAALRQCGQRAEYRRYPGRRLLQNLALGQIDGALMLSYKPKRARDMAFPLRAGQPDPSRRLATFNYVFYVRQDSPLRWDGLRLRGLRGPVGSNTGWSINDALRQQGIAVETGNGLADGFAKLMAKRIAAYALHAEAAQYFLTEHPEFKVRQLQPPIETRAYYWVFSHAFAERHPQTAACLWRQLPALRSRLIPGERD
nr:transporter substrate-binding domain-containing protein [Chromobacterium sp. ASV5]